MKVMLYSNEVELTRYDAQIVCESCAINMPLDMWVDFYKLVYNLMMSGY